jgi:hypothetical protein
VDDVTSINFSGITYEQVWSDDYPPKLVVVSRTGQGTISPIPRLPEGEELVRSIESPTTMHWPLVEVTENRENVIDPDSDRYNYDLENWRFQAFGGAGVPSLPWGAGTTGSANGNITLRIEGDTEVPGQRIPVLLKTQAVAEAWGSEFYNGYTQSFEYYYASATLS